MVQWFEFERIKMCPFIHIQQNQNNYEKKKVNEKIFHETFYVADVTVYEARKTFVINIILAP